ncbi:MAG: glycerophosphodiester phosphodiesterase family protein, partial [Singulisphaera sp.]
PWRGEGKAVVNRFRTLLRRSDRPVLVAHRGDSAHAPENTLAAAQRAWDEGADAWELDVQLSRDGVPVVLHDESLVRTTDVRTRFAGDPRGASGFLVADFDFDEIRKLDAGSGSSSPRAATGPPRPSGRGAPRPRRACPIRLGSRPGAFPGRRPRADRPARLVGQRRVEVVPGHRPSALRGRVRVIRRTRTASRVLISSFDHADVARATRHAPEIATGVLAATPVYRPSEYVREHVRADTYHPSAEVLGVRSNAYRRRPCAASLRLGDLEALRRDDVPVLVYTVNDSAPGGRLSPGRGRGLRLFTDDPRGLPPSCTRRGGVGSFALRPHPRGAAVSSALPDRRNPIRSNAG